MSRPRRSKIIYQPDIGIKQDFETLLQRFSELETVRYEAFASVWRDMNMSLFCAGRQSQKECREFVEECLYIAVQFWLPPSSFLVRVGAVYLLYGLFNYQLVIPKAKIRITPEQWITILEFQDEVRDQQHLDLDYVFQKMVMEKAFIFVSTPRELYPTQKDQDEATYIPDNLKEENFAIDEIFSSSALNQLSLVHDQYRKMKVALNSGDAPDTSLNIVHSDWIANIYRTLRTFREKRATAGHVHSTGTGESMEEDKNEHSTEQSMSRKKQLKHKAFELSTSPYRSKGLNRPKGQIKGEGQKVKVTSEEEDSEINVKEGTFKGPVIKNHKCVWQNKRGRVKQIDLYTDDDMDQDSDGGYTALQDTLSMPELPNYDLLERKLYMAKENARLMAFSESDGFSEEDKPSTSKKGKTPINGKAVVKGKSSKKSKTSVKKGVLSDSETLKKEVNDSESDADSKQVKQIIKMSPTSDSDSEKIKGPSAQERLQQKLNQRKKEARAAKKSAGKRKTGKRK